MLADKTCMQRLLKGAPNDLNHTKLVEFVTEMSFEFGTICVSATDKIFILFLYMKKLVTIEFCSFVTEKALH